MSAARTISTPPRTTAAPPRAESPGTWRHPRLREIAHRQESSNFTERNAKRIVVNISIALAIFVANAVLSDLLPSRRTFPYDVWYYFNIIYWLLLTLPLLNIGFNLLPVLRPKDDLSDIPLTPGQRRLLGLPPSSAPPTPGSAYSTPPRYSRTPSISGSAGSRRSFSSPGASTHSPSASTYGSPANGNGSSFLGVGGSSTMMGSPGSPLLHKAMQGARRSSFSSLNSPSSSTITSGASIFGGPPPDTPSPNPAAGKRSSVSLNSKWLYEKGRESRSTGGSSWLYS